ncbi:putative adhesion G protein-coupled receptor E4P [Larimichthys crocea]|uniref:Putative adhesion G protein-coupled receptor E4P n=1 Tax=Larimichthys crocea TaxID=215358 RepID=A0A6G0HVS4_LARCR|nr:putative adhesion G protein-coupled receptor E4P [Larimichthys crocea]
MEVAGVGPQARSIKVSSEGDGDTGSVILGISGRLVSAIVQPGQNKTKKTVKSPILDLSVETTGPLSNNAESSPLSAKGNIMEINLESLAKNNNGTAAAAFMTLDGMESLLSHQYFETENMTEMYSDVITATLPSMKNTNLTEPVNFTIYHKKPPPEDPFLEWLNRMCVIVGLFFFALAILTFLLCSWNPKINNTARLHMCISLSLTHLLLLWNDRYVERELACTVMAGLLHFLVVASFVWMLMEALQLYLLVRRLSKVQVIQRDGLPRPLLYLIGYGVPFVIVGTSALVYSDGYGATEAEVCWLSRQRNFNWALTGPVIAVLGLNWILFCATLWSLRPTLANMKSDVSQSKDTRLIVFKIVAQFVILGCTWILGLYQTNLFFQVLFIILNSQQGTFLFIVHCVLNKEVREEYIKWLTCSFIKHREEGSVCSTSGDCTCVSGYEIPPTHKPDPSSYGCVDIDECQKTAGICGSDSKCNNTIGAYFCTCLDGFNATDPALPPDSSNQCIDLSLKTIGPGSDDDNSAPLTAKGQTMEINLRALASANNGSAAAAFLTLNGMESLLSHQYFKTENKTEMNSDVFTAVLPTLNNTNLTEPVNFTIQHKKKVPESGMVTCVYWEDKTKEKEQNDEGGEEEETMRWSVEGCWVAYTDENYTVCSCSHLSTFALIMQIGEPPPEDPFLEWLNRMCVIVGLFFFALAILTFLLCSWNPKINNTARLHMCLNLSLSHLLLLWNDRYVEQELACTVMAGLLHFLVVASFVWMLLEALQLYLLVRRLSKVQVIQRDGLPRPLLYLIGYGVPFVIVGTSALVYSKGYGATEAEVCWLSRQRNFNWALTGPVIVILGLNWILFCATLWSLRPTLANMKSDVSQSKDTRLILFKIVAQFVILGCTWILGLYQTNLFFQVLFIILNSQQGTFLFIVHCVLNKEIIMSVSQTPVDPLLSVQLREAVSVFLDIDECVETPDICGPYSTCNNTIGAYFCTCLEGYNATDPALPPGKSNQCIDLSLKTIGPGSDDDYSAPLTAKGQTMEINLRALAGANNGSAAAAFLTLNGMESLLSHQYFKTENKTEMNSDVFTAVLPTLNNTNLTEPVNFTIQHKKKVLESGMVTCVYWEDKTKEKEQNDEGGEEEETMRWSVEGCWVAYTDENYTVCSCSHLSTFALIMQIGEPPPEDPFLEWLNRMCVIVGLFFFALAILTFLLCSWNPKINNTARLHMCLNLSLSHLLLLWNDRYVEEELACTVMAGLLHFLVVASFVWMLLEALQLHLLVRRLSKVQVIQRDGLPRPLLYLIGYGVPFVIVGASALVYSDGYGATEAEVLIVFKIVAQFVILGCTWILGLYQSNLFFQVLFILLNSQQGTFLFIVHCVLNKEVREEYIKWLTCSFGKDTTVVSP